MKKNDAEIITEAIVNSFSGFIESIMFNFKYHLHKSREKYGIYWFADFETFLRAYEQFIDPDIVKYKDGMLVHYDSKLGLDLIINDISVFISGFNFILDKKGYKEFLKWLDKKLKTFERV